MIKTGTVEKIENGYATVTFKQEPQCDRCGRCKKAWGGKAISARVKNDVGVNVGDTVKVDLKERRSIFAAFIYALPLALVCVGMAIGLLMSMSAAVILAATGFVVGLIVAIMLDKTVLKSAQEPKLLSVEETSGEEIVRFDDAPAWRRK